MVSIIYACSPKLIWHVTILKHRILGVDPGKSDNSYLCVVIRNIDKLNNFGIKTTLKLHRHLTEVVAANAWFVHP